MSDVDRICRDADRALEAQNSNARVCARLVLKGSFDGAREYAERAEASRALWREFAQQCRDIRRTEAAA